MILQSRSDLIKLLNHFDKEISEISFSTAIKVYDNYITVKLKSREENYLNAADFYIIGLRFDINFGAGMGQISKNKFFVGKILN